MLGSGSSSYSPLSDHKKESPFTELLDRASETNKHAIVVPLALSNPSIIDDLVVVTLYKPLPALLNTEAAGDLVLSPA